MRTRWIHQILLIIYLGAAMNQIGDTSVEPIATIKNFNLELEGNYSLKKMV